MFIDQKRRKNINRKKNIQTCRDTDFKIFVGFDSISVCFREGRNFFKKKLKKEEIYIR